jgi:hypothetical protein
MSATRVWIKNLAGCAHPKLEVPMGSVVTDADGAVSAGDETNAIFAADPHIGGTAYADVTPPTDAEFTVYGTDGAHVRTPAVGLSLDEGGVYVAGDVGLTITAVPLAEGVAASTSAAVGAASEVEPAAGAAASDSEAVGGATVYSETPSAAGVAASDSEAVGAAVEVEPAAGAAASDSEAVGAATAVGGSSTDPFYPTWMGQLGASNGSTWAGARSNATANWVFANNNANIYGIGVQATYNAGGDPDPDYYSPPFYVARIGEIFDLTSLAGRTVDSVTLAIRDVNAYYPDAQAPYAWNPASLTTPVAGDFALAKWGSTAFATGQNGGANTTVTFTLNSTGIAAVQAALGGKFGIGLRCASDATNTEPAWDSGPQANSYCTGVTVNCLQGSGTNHAVLTIVSH